MQDCRKRHVKFFDHNNEELPSAFPLWEQLVHFTSENPSVTDPVMALGSVSRRIRAVLPHGHIGLGEAAPDKIKAIPFTLDTTSLWSSGQPSVDSLLAMLTRSLNDDGWTEQQIERLVTSLQNGRLAVGEEGARDITGGYSLRDNHSFKGPSWMFQEYMTPIVWDALPKGLFNDIGLCLRGVGQVIVPVGPGGKRVWLLWGLESGEEFTEAVMLREETFYAEWASLLNEEMKPRLLLNHDVLARGLKPPLIAITEGSTGLYIPPTYKYCSWVIEPGFTVSITQIALGGLRLGVYTVANLLEASSTLQCKPLGLGLTLALVEASKRDLGDADR